MKTKLGKGVDLTKGKSPPFVLYIGTLIYIYQVSIWRQRSVLANISYTSTVLLLLLAVAPAYCIERGTWRPSASTTQPSSSSPVDAPLHNASFICAFVSISARTYCDKCLIM
jgi:hypothetical protein